MQNRLKTVQDAIPVSTSHELFRSNTSIIYAIHFNPFEWWLSNFFFAIPIRCSSQEVRKRKKNNSAQFARKFVAGLKRSTTTLEILKQLFTFFTIYFIRKWTQMAMQRLIKTNLPHSSRQYLQERKLSISWSRIHPMEHTWMKMIFIIL